MTDQPNLPPELIDPIANIIFRMRRDNEVSSSEIARAVAPMLIAHGRELEKAEVVAWMRELATHSTKYGPTTIADNIESGHFARWAEAHGRNGHRSK